jgi:hypothetical protein
MDIKCPNRINRRSPGSWYLPKKKFLTVSVRSFKVLHITSQQGKNLAKSKRTSVGFQPATYAALEELADASGQSIASLVSGFMDEAAPSFSSVAQAIRFAKIRPLAALDLLQENLAQAQHLAAQGQLDLVESRKRHNKRRAKT